MRKFTAKEVIEIFGELRTHHNYKVKNGKKCSCWFACSEPYRLLKELEIKLHEKENEKNL